MHLLFVDPMLVWFIALRGSCWRGWCLRFLNSSRVDDWNPALKSSFLSTRRYALLFGNIMCDFWDIYKDCRCLGGWSCQGLLAAMCTPLSLISSYTPSSAVLFSPNTLLLDVTLLLPNPVGHGGRAWQLGFGSVSLVHGRAGGRGNGGTGEDIVNALSFF